MRSFQVEWFAGAAALFYVILYPCVLAFQLWSTGEGIGAVLRALTGVEIFRRCDRARMQQQLVSIDAATKASAFTPCDGRAQTVCDAISLAQ